MEPFFVCEVCGNSDPRYLGVKHGSIYCRKCISFRGELAARETIVPKEAFLDLSYSLSKEQRMLSDRIVLNFQKGIDTLVYAVCGSGKTEISYGVIGYAMSRGLRVGFALPRRDVVIELYHRLEEAFPNNRIIAVFGGHHEVLEGDCVILTTHQLYRYPDYFDLLVMDEVDAFPFKGSDLLHSLYRRSLKGHCLLMSATPSKELVREFRSEGHELLTLHTRFHRHPIPVPKCLVRGGAAQLFEIVRSLKRYEREKKQTFIFVPTIDLASSLYRIISLFAKKGNYVSSKKKDRAEVIQSFKQGKLRYLVTTAVLERGITVSNLQVIVYRSDHRIYDAASLIQIAGRAGRKMNAPTGDVLFLAEKITPSMERAVREIRYCNRFLPPLLSANQASRVPPVSNSALNHLP